MCVPRQHSLAELAIPLVYSVHALSSPTPPHHSHPTTVPHHRTPPSYPHPTTIPPPPPHPVLKLLFLIGGRILNVGVEQKKEGKQIIRLAINYNYHYCMCYAFKLSYTVIWLTYICTYTVTANSMTGAVTTRKSATTMTKSATQEKSGSNSGNSCGKLYYCYRCKGACAALLPPMLNVIYLRIFFCCCNKKIQLVLPPPPPI